MTETCPSPTVADQEVTTDRIDDLVSDASLVEFLKQTQTFLKAEHLKDFRDAFHITDPTKSPKTPARGPEFYEGLLSGFITCTGELSLRVEECGIPALLPSSIMICTTLVAQIVAGIRGLTDHLPTIGEDDNVG